MGTPNKATAESRALFKAMLEDLAPQMENWIRLGAEEDPLQAASLVLRLAEFHIPKIQRMTLDITQVSLAEILAELKRREAAEVPTQ